MSHSIVSFLRRGQVRLVTGFATGFVLLGAHVLAVYGATPAAGPIHRWSFNNLPGGVTGAIIPDLVGTASAAVRGGTGAFAGGGGAGVGIDLGGGLSSQGTYIDLPNGILSKNSTDRGGSGEVTLECWITPSGSQSWSRIFDFGSSTVGEISGLGGTFAGADYLFYSIQNGGDRTTRRVEISNRDGQPVTGVQTFDFRTAAPLGTEIHAAVTWHEASGEVKIYEDGVLKGQFVTSARLSQINDVNNWLGRSNYSNDGNSSATYDEFRIYNRVLSKEDVARSFRLGPELVFPIAGVANYWRANGSGEDAMGNSPAIQEVLPVNYAEGYNGGAFEFTGTGERLIVQGDTSSIPVPWTVGFWLRREDSPAPSAAILAGAFPVRGESAIKAEQFQAGRRIGITQYGVRDVQFDYVAPAGNWKHITLVAQEGGTSLYVDGVFKERVLFNMPLSRNFIGGESADAFKGGLDELIIIPRALQAGEIPVLRDATAARISRTLSGVIVGLDGQPVAADGIAVELMADITRLETFGHVPYAILPPVARETVPTVDFPARLGPLWTRGPSEYIGAVWDGRFAVAAGSGVFHAFELVSDDGGAVFLNSGLLGMVDGNHGDVSTGVLGGRVTPGIPQHIQIRMFNKGGPRSARGLWQLFQPGEPNGQRIMNPPGGFKGYYYDFNRLATTVSDGEGGFTFLNAPVNLPMRVRLSKPGYTFKQDGLFDIQSGQVGFQASLLKSPPTLSSMPDQTIDEDSSVTIPISVSDLQTAADLLQVEATVTTALGNLFPGANLAIVGAGQTRTLTLQPLPNANGVVKIRVRVIDRDGQSVERSFTLTVTSLQDPPIAGSRTGIRLDGIDDLVRTDEVGGLGDGTGSRTVEAWVRLGAFSRESQQMMLLGQTDGASEVWSFGNGVRVGPQAIPVLKTDFGLLNGAASTRITTVQIYAQRWIHLATVWRADQKTYTLYTNGVPVATVNIPQGFALGAAPLTLGSSLTTKSSAPFVGDIDELRVWSRALDVGEILRGMRRPPEGRASGLMLSWRFDETVGGVAVDSASDPLQPSTLGGRSDGMLSGNPVYVTGVNLDKTASVQKTLVGEDTPTEIYLTGYDAEFHRGETSVAPQFQITRIPAKGVLNRSFGNWNAANQNPIVYTPDSNATGDDSFDYTLTDASGATSGEFTVPVLITDVNDLPTLSNLAAEVVIEEDTSSSPLPFNVSDPETDPQNLQIGFEVVETSLSEGFVMSFAGNDTNRTVVITPAVGQIGEAKLLIKLTDEAGDVTSREIRVSVIPKPAYAVFNLGTLPSKGVSSAYGLNDLGWAVGGAQNTEVDVLPFLNRGIDTIEPTLSLGLESSVALAVNSLGRMAGFNRQTKAGFTWFNGVATPLVNLLGGTSAEGRAINEAGVITGVADVGGVPKAVLWLSHTNSPTRLDPSGEVSEANGLNADNLVVGFKRIGGQERAVLFASNTVVQLGSLPNHTVSRAVGINAAGVIVGYSQALASSSPRAFVFENNRMRDLGTLPGGSLASAVAINDPGQIVGYAGTSDNRKRAFLYSAQRFYDLNDLIPPEGGWTLTDARAINKRGWIVGTGTLPNGEVRAFLAVPARTIGRQIARPLGSVARLPEITIIGDNAGAQSSLDAFAWSDVQKKLYAIRPVRARLSWFTSLNDTSGSGTNLTANTNRVVEVGVNVWPRNPTVHIAGAPVELQPAGVSLPYSWQRIEYETSGNVLVDPNTRIYQNSQPSYTVIRYLITSNAPIPQPNIHPPTFDVVRTYTWDDSAVTGRTPWLVGETISNTNHVDYYGKNGFVFFEKSFYDGAGAERAYDRVSRLGPIIPVNTATASTQDAPNKRMVVVWYQTNRLGVAWAARPILYELSWPTATPDKIVIASTLGAGVLPASQYPEKRVYVQSDKTQAGFNPNEEHALIAAGSVGTTLYALRDDLNTSSSSANAPYVHSAPFALLKFRDPDTQEWRIRPYRVIAEETPYFFRYTGVAGNPIQPPLPLSTLPLCDESYGLSGPFWEDKLGTLYARAAGPDGGTTNVVIRWFYKLQPSFYYDLSGNDGINDEAVGTCIPWLDRRPRGQKGVPVDVAYTIRWPDQDDILQVGETLLKAKASRIEPGVLPEIQNQARAEIVFDSLNPTYDPTDPFSALTATNLARLYDPVSARTLRTNITLPSSIQRRNVSGQEEFTDLPWALKVRLRYDPINRWLTFRGYLDATFDVGEPLLLPNVMTLRERDRLLQLASDSRDWVSAVTNLYNLTRNPNAVDLDHLAPNPDIGLRVGLVNEYVVRLRRQQTNAFNNTVADVIVTNRLTYRPDDAPTLGDWIQRQLGVPLVISATNSSGGFILATNIVPEALGDQPKALTAALGGVPTAKTLPGSALRFDGAQGFASSVANISLDNSAFTIELWAKRDVNGPNQTLLTHAGSSSARRLTIGWRFDQGFLFSFDSGATGLVAPPSFSDTDWHHWACTYDPTSGRRAIYRDGILAASDKPAQPYLGSAGPLWLGKSSSGNFFKGELDGFRLWNSAISQSSLARRASQRLKGTEATLLVYYRFDEEADLPVTDLSGHGLGALLQAGASRVQNSTAPVGIPPRYITVAMNNASELATLGVTLKVIRVDDGPFAGDLKVLSGDNVFDQRVTFRHSSEFGGDPGPFEFEWWYQEDSANFDPAKLPAANLSAAALGNFGWKQQTFGPGVNDTTTGEGGESGLIVMSDTWWICRYRGYEVNRFTTNDWAGWVGDPSGSIEQPRAKLSEGWIKRVIRGLNPFDARVQDFRAAAVNTIVSMIAQAGRRYEGDIAFNPGADNLNSIGLIEAYETVLRRGKSLSIEGTPPVNFDPANNALLLASSKISDLYMLLGNEAYADAQDPTIGFSSSSGDYGSLSSSIFAFQNQLDSLLEEELTLLRGRDDGSSGVNASPVYNRLFWNFTLGEGEVAYRQVYNIKDLSGPPNESGRPGPDGNLDERDGRSMFPQGHGDAWGHYLTAIKTYYKLLRHPYFTWVPRAENVSVAGTSIKVDFLDERKFARAAVAKAKTGREIMDLTYRQQYTEAIGGQWQGYKDTDAERAWGVTDWARRAGQGATFDWLVANAILPSTDPNADHTGIERVDRQTVTEISDIAAQLGEIQTRLDMADAGLNPVGVVKGAMVFDIDPTFNAVGSTAQIGRQAVQGLGHFEQIKERAVKCLNNASRVWDEANRASAQLRDTEDSLDAFTRDYRNREVDFKNRLIEIFGYPYAGDIGPGKVYPGGYDGPDLYHYMYVGLTEITGESARPSASFVGFFNNISTETGLHTNNYYANFATDPVDAPILQVPYTLSAANGLGYGFAATPEMGARRSQGELQFALSEVLQANAQLKIDLQNYDGLIQDIVAATNLLAAHYDLNAERVRLLNTKKDDLVYLNTLIGIAKQTQIIANRIADIGDTVANGVVEGIPKSVGLATDALAPVRGTIKLTTKATLQVSEVIADVAASFQSALELGKEQVELEAELKLLREEQRFEVLQRVKELEAILRNEAAQRIGVYNQVEVIKQGVQKFLAKLSEGQRLMDELTTYRRGTASTITERRYQDMTFRIFRNDAIQKYRAQFDLAARYCYLAASVYDYETAFLGSDSRTARQYLQDIIRQRALGQLIDGNPVVGSPGLAESIARLEAGFETIRGQFGINNPQLESGAFRLRHELFRMASDGSEAAGAEGDKEWQATLRRHYVQNLWDLPEFRRYCRPFAPESAGAQPGLVIPFSTVVSFGRNFFGWPLTGGDSAYDPTLYSTKINAVGIQFDGYDAAGLSRTPRVFLIPVGTDILRSPTGDSLATREFRIFDQALPIPLPVGSGDLGNLGWIPMNDTLSGQFGQVRRFSSMRAFPTEEFADLDTAEIAANTRLVGRSVWNTQWMLIIPGGTLLANPDQGIDQFVRTVKDIRLLIMSYAYAGN